MSATPVEEATSAGVEGLDLSSKQATKYLSRILTGTDEDAIQAAVERASNEWGIFPDPVDGTDADYYRAQCSAVAITAAIRSGLADGTIKARGKSRRAAAGAVVEDAEDLKVLQALGL